MSNNDSSDQAPWLTPKNPPEQPPADPGYAGSQPPAYEAPSSQPQPYQTPSSSGQASPSFSSQPNYPTPYGSNQYGNPYATPAVPMGYKPQSGLAIAALVTSLLCIPVVSLILSIVAMSDTKDDKKSGRGMAIAGLVISIIQTLLAIAWLGLVFWAATQAPKTGYSSSYTFGPRA